jgi:peptide/nickel transport system ATP-binding protein
MTIVRGEGAPVLAVRGLRIETDSGKEILDEIAFDVFPREVFALVGESGCGKTATALALLGHARPGTRCAAGSVNLDDRDMLSLSKNELRRRRGARISYVAQDPTSSLNPRHRVGKQVAETLVVHGYRRKEAHEAVRSLVERVHLPADEAFLRRYPFELSGGQQQRVAIAMALVSKPLVVVLDEPTTGLDVTTQARVLELLRELAHETQTAFVYVTHDLAVVDGIADRIAVMYAGRVVEQGQREQVFRKPAHPYTLLLLRSVPRLSVRRAITGIGGTAPPPGARPRGCFFAPRCPLADARCGEEFPPWTSVEAGHSVRCWHASKIISENPAAPERSAQIPPRADLLVVDQLTASYRQGASRNRVLQEVSLAISSGSCLAVVGESGSGKTSLGRCIAGLHRPDFGSILLNGSSLAASAAHRTRSERQQIQIVFQNPERSLNPTETVAEAIGRPLRLFRLSQRATERKQISELLDRVRLPDWAIDRYPAELSGGEKQRVAIARALAAQPQLLICDEITSALDVSIQAAIVELLNDLRDEGLALLFITHNLALVNSIADHAIVIEGGNVREQGAIAEIVERPSHPYTRRLLAAAPELGLIENPLIYQSSGQMPPR